MSANSNDDLTFEQALSELERIVRDLEDGQLGLEDSLNRYETGVRLLKQCHGQLQDAEQRISLLTGVDADGKPVLKPFDHSPTAENVPTETKRRRKRESPEFFE